MTEEKKVVIVGGGFGGIRCALDLANKHLPGVKIILISDKPHFEYHASFYRIVTGRSPLEACIPLREIFAGKDIEVLEDTIITIDLKEKKLSGTSQAHYTFDFLVLAVGSTTAYPDIPGLKKFSFGLKSVNDALKLKRHVHEMFSSCVIATDKERECALRFVIVGGGATGTELAGELAKYAKRLAKHQMLDNRLLSIDLIQAGDRLLPSFSPAISNLAQKRLEDLGVKVHLKTRLLKEDIETVYLKDMQMKTKTVIWTAGVVPNPLYSQTKGFSFDEKGKVIVDEYLQSKDCESVFIIGDGAAISFSGLAKTAMQSGQYVADFIAAKIVGESVVPYHPQEPAYVTPIGPRWAIFVDGSVTFSGLPGYFFRRLADLKFFLSILPFGKAMTAFRSEKVV